MCVRLKAGKVYNQTQLKYTLEEKKTSEVTVFQVEDKRFNLKGRA